MSLSSGSRLGVYEIVGPLGAGGMGEVYRARDTKLGREVAIKILPESFVQDRERLARFEREAKVLAALNHPGIATLYGWEESSGSPFLVMELVEGETLSDRIGRGVIPISEALHLFTQIADALEAAHDKGIIHRDLKPANIMITPDGKVKVLDFGLAKAFASDDAPPDAGSQSPTLTKGTALGAILGTASYMSPEQARGKLVDKRTDVWAFGCCLYEALTGQKAFAGETPTDTISAVVRAEPQWDRLPADTPAAIRKLLRRSVTKERNERLADIADGRLEIKETLLTPDTSPQGTYARPGWFGYGVVAIASALLVGFAVWGLTRPTPAPTTRVVVTLPEGQRLVERRTSPIALSPDGRRLAYAADSNEGRQLYLRALDSFQSTVIPGTQGGHSPFFSADGNSLGFFTDESLKKVDLHNGTLTVLAPVQPSSSGGSWGPTGTIVYSPRAGSGATLMQVPHSGGTPALVAETGFFPQILADGDTVLSSSYVGFVAGYATLSSIKTGRTEQLDATSTGFSYVSTGYLVYPTTQTTLAALPFDLEGREPRGQPVNVLDGLIARPDSEPYWTISSSGTLAYVHGDVSASRLMTVDRSGNADTMMSEGVFHMPRFSPSGDRVLYDNSPGLWIYEIASERRTRLTDIGDAAAWSRDGSRIVFRTESSLQWIPSDGSRDAEVLLASYGNEPTWSRDGRFLAYTREGAQTGADLWVLAMDDNVESPFLTTSDDERAPRFSPDGRYVVYQSNESGENEIYVRSFPDADEKWKISADGGMEPVWSRDGAEIFYREGQDLMVVDIQFGERLYVGKARLLVSGDYRVDNTGHPNYDVSPTGQSFVMVQDSQGEPLTEIHVVLNWFDELERLVPAH